MVIADFDATCLVDIAPSQFDCSEADTGSKHLKAKRAKQLLPKFLALIRQFEQSPAKGAGRYVNIVAGAHCTNVAIHQVQRDHRRIPHEDEDALTPSVRFQEF